MKSLFWTFAVILPLLAAMAEDDLKPPKNELGKTPEKELAPAKKELEETLEEKDLTPPKKELGKTPGKKLAPAKKELEETLEEKDLKSPKGELKDSKDTAKADDGPKKDEKDLEIEEETKPTLQEFIDNYPKFDKKVHLEEAQKLADERYKTFKPDEIVSVVIRNRKYSGDWSRSRGKLHIGNKKFHWVDVPKKIKYMFDKATAKVMKNEFIALHLQRQKLQYTRKRSKEIDVYKKSLIPVRTIVTNKGRTYTNAEIINRNPMGIEIRYADRYKFLKFRHLSKRIQDEFDYDPIEAQRYERKHGKRRKKKKKSSSSSSKKQTPSPKKRLTEPIQIPIPDP